MKYIIVSDCQCELAIMFDEILTHSEVAQGKNVLSAGKCSKDGIAYGGSVSLKTKARPQDTKIIQDAINRTI